MKIALIGNPNSGKTTLFNLLTGMNSKIGNWPGVTIEKKTGVIKGTTYQLVDLPGIYSLSPYSTEEEISRKYIFDEKPDVIINIIDGTSLGRSLYLTTQLLELDTKIVIALNMTDILEKKGIFIDIKELEKELGIDIVEISAFKKTGISNLISSLSKSNIKKDLKKYDSDLENAILKIEKNIDKELILNKKFIAIKLLEEDKNFKKYENNKIRIITENLKTYYKTDLEEIIATERYDFIDKLMNKVMKKNPKKNNISAKLDFIFLNKWIAFPVFFLIMFFIYYLSIDIVGSYAGDLINGLFEAMLVSIENIFISFNISKWIISLVVDGITTGVGSVLNFIPQLIVLFMCISILETTGYMSRIALLLDKPFRKIGLSGKSIIPFIIGGGCSVPGIMGSRIIENQNERKVTIILTPFIPCSAKLPIIALFTRIFFC